jgi:hypothetical protein
MSEDHAHRAHPEHVVLELGGELGALVVYTGPGSHGLEIEISRSGEDRVRSHKDVLERSLGGRPAFAAVFDRLEEGSYTLWVGGAPRARGVEVVGGRVGELDWRR